VASKSPLGSIATDLFDYEERGARAAMEFIRRAATARELPPCPLRPAVARTLRRVKFTEEPPFVSEVVPYSEIYGLHPREFVFCRNHGMVPSQGQFGFNGFDFSMDDVDDEEDNCDSDDEFAEFDESYEFNESDETLSVPPGLGLFA
jgi:hypothetical protein